MRWTYTYTGEFWKGDDHETSKKKVTKKKGRYNVKPIKDNEIEVQMVIKKMSQIKRQLRKDT